ncbi:hypothetical protein Sste5346_005069 [Sporothrix stenoceras]|uniref:U-box domain-containing protein n=1 Tax=Sporothrix stenoceras TaxID=5173 RepID=A0ABR3Z4P4_9PEZI
MDPDRANLLKAEGNKRFMRAEFAPAEALYSQAIILDPKNPNLYTNRALARLRLERWGEAADDCNTCLERAPDNMKALYYLSQAELKLRDFDAAITHCRRAHDICVQTNDKSLTPITAHMLDCKKARWEYLEKKRAREASPLEAETIALFEREKETALASLGEASDSDRAEIAAEWDAKLASLRDTFAAARNASAATARRNVPDWAIDDITFAIMVDPVVTNTGKSYERAAILEHLRRQETDPLTREVLKTSDLRPNLDLRAACEEFLDENGWAVDW